MEILIRNLYEELEGLLSITESDPKAVQKAIDDKIIDYNKKINNPKYRSIVPLKINALKELKSEITANPKIIKQHAKAYSEISRQKQLESEKKIREYGNIFVKNGMIDQKSLTSLASKHKMQEAEILRILGATIKTQKVFKYKDDGIKELSKVEMDKIAENLKILGKKDLYDFLEIPPNASLAIIKKQRDAKFKSVSSNSNKSNPDVSATDALVKICTFFDKPDGKRSYDKALENKVFEDVRETIKMMSVISAEDYKKFLDICASKGINRDKAEFLIYSAANEKNIQIDEGKADNAISCRFCGALNDKGMSSCRSCGMPIAVICPKCGRKNANDELICQCGFSIIDMKEADIHLSMAKAALQYDNIDDAKKELDLAKGYWGTCPRISEIDNEILNSLKKQKSIRDEIQNLCKSKRYYSARQKISLLPANDSLRKETENAILRADSIIKAANATTDTNLKLDYYIQALEICADCEAASSKMKLLILQSPVNLRASIIGQVVRLTWDKAKSNYITYQIVRKEDVQPSGINDGETVGATKNTSLDDSSAAVGKSYYYAVYSKYSDFASPDAAMLRTPVMRVEELDANAIKVNINETSVEFAINFPRGLHAVEIYRDSRLVKTMTATSYIDGGLTMRRTYTYKFVAVYKDSSGVLHKSNGISMPFTPLQKPRSVDLTVQDYDKTALLRWSNPTVGTLCIYYSDTAFNYNKNEVIAMDTFKANRVNVSGNSYTVNKNFIGERFYMPVVVQGNIGVAGNMISVVSVPSITDIDIARNGNYIDAKWNCSGASTVRICYSIDGEADKMVEIRAASYRITIPNSAKSIRIKATPFVKSSSGKTFDGETIEKMFNLKDIKIDFVEVCNIKKYLLVPTDDFSITIRADSYLPCDIYLLISERYPPIDLVNISPIATISKSEVAPNAPFTKSFSYVRKNKRESIHFRLVASDNNMSKQINITPETKEIK